MSHCPRPFPLEARIAKMATRKYPPGPGVQSDIRTSFTTKEGGYRVVKASQYNRPSGQPLFGKELSHVHVSFVSCKDKEGPCEWVVFNAGRELYFYPFEGVGKIPDLRHPLDKRVYKLPTIPVVHDFNQLTRSTARLDLIVGFSTGPLQYLNPLERKAICAFNEDGSIDSSKVTCVKWVPASETSFVSSHRSGNLFVWSTEFTGKSNGPQNYTLCKELQDASIYAVKPKNKSPVLFRWNIGHGAINNFAFSPDVTHIAIASQDGFLRIYNFKTQEFYGRMRSYFGGFLCICWSPDGRYAVTGGEDDLITVWSFEQRRVVARGEGHKSYVSFVAFDPYTTVLPDTGFSSSAIADSLSGAAQRELLPLATSGTPTDRSSTSSGSLIGRAMSDAGERERCVVAYRLGSVGQDTQLCLWDLSGDALKPRRTFLRSRSRASRIGGPQTSGEPPEGAPPPTAAQESAERDRKSVDLESAGNDALHGDSGKSPSAADGKDSYSPPAPGDKIASSLHSKAATVNHTSASGHQPSGTPASDEFAPSASSSSLTEKRSSRARSALKHLSGTAETNGPPREEDNESSPSVGSEQSASERTNGKKEKKHRKDKEKKGTRIREPVKKVMRFVGNISGGGNHHHHAYRREVGTFESCNSDDIAPKMHEVNLIEPLVAKKIGHERLTVLVFREDCIVAAGQDGFVHTWSRPGFELPEETKDDAVSSRPFRGSVTSNPPGLNSPKPGGGPDPVVKSTTV